MTRIPKSLRTAKDWLFTHKLRAAILAVVLVFTAPWPARAQFGLDPCCAMLAAGLASVQSALTSVVGGSLNQILGVDKAIEQFNKAVPLTGLVVTKLDGTSKGGMVVAIQKELGLPIKFVGLGEQAEAV